ncbi:putative ligase [Helianthus annuus]|nr:putative ligase [Helianthus annuus]
MYAETTARGNVLEPEGMIEIKFRNKDLLECMNRLDPQIRNLKQKLQEAKYDQTITDQIKAREKQLLPIYTQIATKFAELHDTAFRMAEKGVVKKVVDWNISRVFFYKRLRRRLAEASLICTTRDAAGDKLSYKAAYDMIKKWFLDTKTEQLWLDDEAFFTWKDDPSNYADNLAKLRTQKVSNQLLKIGGSPSDLEALPQGLAALLQEVDPTTKSKLVEELRRVIETSLAK